MTTENKVKNPLEMTMSAMNAAVAKWETENTPELLASQVRKKLDAHKHEIVLKLLGFNTGYSDSWQLDHCNGRSGNSAAGDYIVSAQKEAVKTWLESVCMPVVSPTIKKKLAASIQAEFGSMVEYHMRQHIDAKAKDLATEYMQSLEASEFIDNFVKTNALLKDQHQ